MTLVLIALAGGVGAAARFVVDGVVRSRAALPWLGTTVVNVSGSFLIGLLAGFAVAHAVPATWHAVVATGFLGGYTTFSTAAVEGVVLLRAGERRRAAVYVLGVAVVSALVCSGGFALGSL
ncbi:Camphor resistance CrcB protein [Beutenbergia cavernae DSM 12333]|uniref:Fluoride-specific ion channel FluC n=1 Tax=Beutenbergia cavernae (strain ATCC BAA-8 / DSM 12333 / CCUG 43141 / JCM 11478 / NBRC 16432 / NCIMB 13614 / HKI 0122) TaxID=471853 RepID=C5BXB3_BEUC1|nr:CrcB family protein [Beutenbergia cavernae]ACQ78788.1 Camphor resistance CrcB protein [Beutenbergia cavernae DSM 12333]